MEARRLGTKPGPEERIGANAPRTTLSPDSRDAPQAGIHPVAAPHPSGGLPLRRSGNAGAGSCAPAGPMRARVEEGNSVACERDGVGTRARGLRCCDLARERPPEHRTMAARLRLPQGEADVSCLLEEGRSPRPVSARKPVERADSLTSLDSPGSLGTTGTPGSVRSPQPGSGSLQVALPAWNAESFQVGEVGRIVSLVTMRAREGFEKSEVIMELPPGSRVRVAARGRGRRVCVRDIVSGREGWISVRTAAGETLLSKERG